MRHPDAGPRLAGLDEALGALQAGRPVLVLDDESRENEGDVVLAAALATPEWLAWTVRHTSGLVCAPMPHDVADRLALPPMVRRNEDSRGTAFTVTVDARFGVTTGISAADRAVTLRRLADPATGPEELVRPGHVLPLRGRAGGVRERAGHTEAAVELCRQAGLPPVAGIAELVRDDGGMMRRDDVLGLGRATRLPVITVASLVDLARTDAEARWVAGAVPPRVQRTSQVDLPTRFGTFTAVGYRDQLTGAEHVALTAQTRDGAVPMARVHSECLTGDTLGSLRCDCGPQLQASLRLVAEQGGAVVYLGGHEGRGVGLLAKLEAYALQDRGWDTVDANLVLGLPVDAREFGAAAAVLHDLGMSTVRLLSNNPAKERGLRDHGIAVAERVPLHMPTSPHNRAYLATKRTRLGHDLPPGSGDLPLASAGGLA